MQQKAWLGIDTGGTFTDLVLVDAARGTQWLHKTPTTPADASRGILDGMAEILRIADLDASEVALVCHGTTLATNAVLERKWVRTGMITTAGFRDVIELARQRRPSFFNLDLEKPAPPASRDLRLEVAERIAPDGTVVTALDEDAVRDAVATLKARGAQAISVCFLHAYANPAHERRAVAIVREMWPDAFVCASSDILAEFREYERFSTASVNASLLPVIDRYLDRFERGVAGLGIAAQPTIMQSNGGAVSPASVRRTPINTFFSGPAGGVIGAVGLGAAVGVKDIITFDMGGTSTDVALIRNGVPAKHNVREMGGFPVRTRTLDIHTIGAGGGSIAWVDPGGLLKVGPQSAGAMPGPAAYGRGGDRPTVTDANIVLGRLNQRALLQGRMAVFPDLARKAIEAHLCAPLDMDLVRAASGIIEIVNVNMMGAVRVISVERGEDPRDFALMPFGGAGPLHAADVAAMMGMPRVFVPQRPGLLSAMGLLHADARGDFSLTRLVRADPASLDALNIGLADLAARGAAWLEQEAAGAPAVFEWQGDLRYFGQNFELASGFPSGHLDGAALAAMVARFHAAHAAAYGYAMPDRPVEIVNLRLSVTVQRPVPPLNAAVPRGVKLRDALIDERDVWFFGAGFQPAPVYDRDRMPADVRFHGPAIVEQMDTTTVIPPGATVDVDPAGNLMIAIPTVAEGRVQ
ncbi:hydantoinase/oxoprolinase family protein [Aquabacter spiritensis]|uniref:N-methylhydantoinase A n=1 Tax=Aquabacter spiritensis TaxID=933073 RepID=A0A4R3M100_9HYPH|nr:hydantoinase/oxoprolinase family protein [Aquabacter spiritensis]TCT06771.1 N-methylhydantoinase A [Aquabacter spiritensis]